MIQLTEEQQRAVDAGESRLVDPRTNKAYVLVEAGRYERIQNMLDDEDGLTMRQVAVLVDRAMREDDADDPTLEYYQQKYGRKP